MNLELGGFEMRFYTIKPIGLDEEQELWRDANLRPLWERGKILLHRFTVARTGRICFVMALALASLHQCTKKTSQRFFIEVVQVYQFNH